jgi:GNAT superfamily N-acetyltransferase
MQWWAIRHASLEDIPAIKRIAYQYRQELGFVNRAALGEAVTRRELYVCELPDGAIAGFVRWHARRDGWHTIYEIAVDKDHAGRGIGRALLYAVPTPIRLKCTVDNEAGNRFYAGAGLVLAATEPGRKRALNVWELPILSILVKGNNRQMPEVSRASGMAYGTRHIETPRDWPLMVDIHWRDYDWQDYMDKIAEWRPVMAMVPDYEYPSQRRQLYQHIRDLKAAGVLRIMVCPKFAGAVAHIPSWCLVAVSIPSSYAGFIPEFQELVGRRVHLLGGSPKKQIEMIIRLRGVGIDVTSTDGNSHIKTSQWGHVFDGRVWKRTDRHNLYELSAENGLQVMRAIQRAASGFVQPLLFDLQEE